MTSVSKSANYVRAIMRAGSISSAAIELGVSQPALSAALKKAEQQLGTPIIDRTATPLALTEAGYAFLEYEEGVAKLKRALSRKVSDIEELRCGELSIGGVGTFNVVYLPKAVACFAERYPGINVFVHDGAAPEMAKALLEGSIDILVAPSLAENDAFECVELFSERIYLCVPPDWPVIKRLPPVGDGGYAPIDASDFALLGDCDFITMLDNQAIGKKIAALLDAYGIMPRRIIQANQMLTCLALTMRGVGISLVTESALTYANLTRNPALYLPDEGICSRTLYLATAKNCPVSRATKEFARILKESLS